MANDHRIRIIGGLIKGRRLEVLDMEGLRPTTDRVRETVFNWLGDKTQNARVLDLFAGSGALGLEAFSRGATDVIMVEKDQNNAHLLENEVKTLPKDALQNANVKVVVADALNYLKTLKDKGDEGFDLIFLDPPFASDLLEKAAEFISENGLLKDGGLVYAEMGTVNKKALFGLQMVREDRVGASHFGLYESSFLF